MDPETLNPFIANHYLFAYFAFSLPTLFVMAALFFAVATATRSMMATYLAVVALLIGLFSSRSFLNEPAYEFLGALIDPTGGSAFRLVTKYWTAQDRNMALPGFDGPLLYNRLIWTGIAFGFLWLAYALFQFSEKGQSKKPAKPPVITFDSERAAKGVMPAPRFDAAAIRQQLYAATKIDMAFVFRSPAFAVLMFFGLFNSAAALWTIEEMYGVSIYPVTRACINALQGSFTIIPIIIAIYYSGELVWRDRDRKMHEIIDATPVADWVFVLPKIAAIYLVLLATLLISVLAAMIIQTIKGYYTYEIGYYLVWYVLPTSVAMWNLAILSMFSQAIAPQKYVGWGLMGLYIVGSITLANLGFEHLLYNFGDAPSVPLSDMNGLGQFWIGRDWAYAYWTSFSAILAIVSYGLWRRGAETRFAPRFAKLRRRMNGPAGALVGLLLVALIGFGGFIFYNTNVLNTYRTQIDRDDLMADYEKTLIGYENVPTPRITDVHLDVDLKPHDLSAYTKGTYTVENRTGAPLDKIHIRWDDNLKMVSLDMGAAKLETDYTRFNYRIYALDVPMAPGERREIKFETLLAQRGFRNSANQTRIVDNGTFLNNFEIAPILGMGRDGVLRDRIKRRKHGLPAELRPAKLEDDAANAYNGLRHDSDFVNASITVTTEGDQTPIAPGYKVVDEIIDGRHRIQTQTEAPIENFFSIQSASYAVARDKIGDVDLAIYYHPPHKFNIARMMAAMKLSLEVLPQAFSPYQFKQARMIEFPAYESFAQSFANTIPFSEAIGFILNQDRDTEAIDVTTFVTAHELGHQWWAHQVISSDKQGGSMLVETFAQYSAMLVMERLYGPEQVRKFLKYELDRYLRSRGSEAIEELPLARVENQPYIYYRKGAVVMYFLKDQLGEEVVNRAMRHLLADYAFKPAPYPDTRMFLSYLRAEAGPEHEQLIADLFERITLYDVKVVSAHSHLRADGQFDVSIEVDAKKLTANGQGAETEMPLAEIFDVGLFAKEPGKPGFTKNDVIEFTKLPVKSGRQTLTLVSSKAPSFAGVDPYNKRITRNSDTVIGPVTAETSKLAPGQSGGD